MKVLVITNVFYPDRGGGASVFSDLCFGLAEMGWEVDVFTTYPYYPEWRTKVKAKRLEIASEKIGGVRVWRHGIYVPARPSRLGPRLCYELSFFLSLSRSLWRGGKHDAVMVFCPLFGSVLFAAVRNLFLRERLWLNVQDIPADAASGSGMNSSRLFQRAAAFVQRLLFNRADMWSTISPGMLDRLAKLRNRGQPLHLCRNWLNGSLAEQIARLEPKHGRPVHQPVRLLYAGNIGKKQDLLKFCQRVARSDLAFDLTIHGDGGEARTVEEWIREQHDRRFSFGGFLEEGPFTAALHQADLFLITEKQGSGASFIPSKLIPCIATGTPVLAVCDRLGPLGTEVCAAGLGLHVDWEGLESVGAKLSALLKDKEQFWRFQANCLKHAGEYTRQSAIPRVARLLQELGHPGWKALQPGSPSAHPPDIGRHTEANQHRLQVSIPD
jgi:colanic acid biosynthesis glycosyl transferase WcaI